MNQYHIKNFMSVSQIQAINHGLMGEERQFFIDMMAQLQAHINAMPVTYEQDGLGDRAVVWLHYFKGSMDFYITEKDIDGGIDQAFGLADLGDGGELGYISIRELVENDVELDLYWTNCTLASLKKAA